MPEQNSLTFDDLTVMQQGCVDCIIDCESNSDNAADWKRIGRADFASETLARLVVDCERLLARISGSDADFKDRLFADVDEHDLGWQFILERNGTGVGFAEIDIDQPLLRRLQVAAASLGEIRFEVGGDRKVHLLGHSTPAPLDYGSLTNLQQGFADSLVEFESEAHADMHPSFNENDDAGEEMNDEDEEESEDEEDEEAGLWDGVSVHDFSPEALKIIIEECGQFVAAVCDDPVRWDELFPAVTDYDLGWYLLLERQGAGVGLRDVLEKGAQLDRALKASDALGALHVEVGDDGNIHLGTSKRTPAPTVKSC